MKNKLILSIYFSLFTMIVYSQVNKDTESNQKAITKHLKSDTLTIGHTYWWPNSGPFIGSCGEKYSFVFLGTVTKIYPSIKNTTAPYTSQKGILKIDKILKTKTLPKEKYNNQNYFSSDCFNDLNVKEGNKVIVFCYEYEGKYSIPGKNSIVPIKNFNDPIVHSIKTYIASSQNPLKIKKDLKLWAKKGFDTDLKQLIECAKFFSKTKK